MMPLHLEVYLHVFFKDDYIVSQKTLITISMNKITSFHNSKWLTLIPYTILISHCLQKR